MVLLGPLSSMNEVSTPMHIKIMVKYVFLWPILEFITIKNKSEARTGLKR
ncbi:hypothetical protein OROMI_003053 [Orobanche minor]